QPHSAEGRLLVGPSMDTPTVEFLRAENVSKRYGSVQALEGVHAEFLPRRIHAVLGENGAGKSTLMGVLAGFVNPDSGRVAYNEGSTAVLPSGKPFECRRLGIGMIHQHFTLVNDFSVADNLALYRLDRLNRTFRSEAMAAQALELANKLGWSIDPDRKVGSQPVGVQQRVEILKVLSTDARVLIFDEPTAVLSPAEVAELFAVMRQLADEGRIVILIAHKLSEVFAVADYVTVLRGGRNVGEGEIGAFDGKALADMMVGELLAPRRTRAGGATGPGLRADHLSVLGDRGEPAVRDLSFEVRAGEIVGIGGVDGNGQVELAEALAGVRAYRGSLLWKGKELRHDQVTLGYIPQDRRSDGLAVGMSILDNSLITGHRKSELTWGPFLRARACLQWCRSLMSRFDVRAESPRTPVSTLSGGNQQKVVVGRTLDTMPELLIAVNPTRGLDLHATSFVHETLRDAKSAGTAVVLVSTDLDELSELSDRIWFLSRGSLREAGDAESYVG
ncbi:MAG TPA: ABC transporter ATP-binding protein, partial [Fimbriimonas sp.]